MSETTWCDHLVQISANLEKVEGADKFGVKYLKMSILSDLL